jgi:hypothetical protein
VAVVGVPIQVALLMSAPACTVGDLEHVDAAETFGAALCLELAATPADRAASRSDWVEPVSSGR